MLKIPKPQPLIGQRSTWFIFQWPRSLYVKAENGHKNVRKDTRARVCMQKHEMCIYVDFSLEVVA